MGHRRPLPWLLLLLLAAAFANDQCPMNVSRPAPEDAYRVNDVLWARESNKSYTPASYRPVQDGGFVLCTCEMGACIRKCCPENWVYVGGGRCSELNASQSYKFEIPELVNENGTVSTYGTGMFHIVYEKLTCSESKYRLTPSSNKFDSFKITNKGWLLNVSGAEIASPDKFCLESFAKDNFQILPVVCSAPEKENEEIGGNMLYTIGMILSLPFLFSTFLVYALIKDLQNLHGKSLMCHVATLMVAYTSLITVQFVTNYVTQEWCVFLAYAVQFTFLASFFWLNVMCFDLWWTFSGFRPLRGNLQENEAKKFIIYSIYAWGSTALITIITFCMEEYLPAGAIRPELGITRCWFTSFTATLLYFYGPIGILLFSNLLMFIHTAIMIVKHMKDAKVLSGSESRRNVDLEKQRFMLYLKLFIVMGVNWLMEIISWAAGSDGTEKKWFITDIGNSLQGVLIFLIFVCKKRVLNLLNKKLCPRFQLFKTSTASTRTTNSTASGNSSNTKNKDAIEMSANGGKTSTNNQLQDFKV